MPQWIFDINNPSVRRTDLVTNIMIITAKLTGEGSSEFYGSRKDKAFLLKSKVRRRLLEEGFTLEQVGYIEKEITGIKTHHSTIIHSRDTSLGLIERKYPSFNEELEKELEHL